MIRSKAMFILAWPRWLKRLTALALDFVLCMFTTWLAFYLRLGVWVDIWGEQLTPDLLVKPWLATIAAILISVPIFILLGLYRTIFRYSGWPALLTIAKAISLYGMVFAGIFTVIGIQGIPRTIGLIQPLLLLFSVGASRAFVSHWFGNSYREQLLLGNLPKVLIYGAGAAGRELAAAIRNTKKMQVVGFIDDDLTLHGNNINGLKIYRPSNLNNLIVELEISDILLAIPSISRARRSEIIDELSKLKVSVQTLPSLQDLASGKISVTDIHDLDIEDLLGRDLVTPDPHLLAKNIFNKVVLVTGAGGSIGSELCRQIIYQKPSQIILLDQSEFALYTIERELIKLIQDLGFGEVLITPILASVRSERSMRALLNQHRPYIIFHAAAYKHVPLVEQNPADGILNNVYGTKNIANLASEFAVSHFILVSTDKAVRPTNIMGASKRLAEMILQALANDPEKSKNTAFSMVRFGNVLNSSGSVVPLFKKQIQEGGPITLTHLEVTRFFMMIPEAAQLVIQASALAKGGEVFVLDMGKPVKILDLAKKMIQLSGLKLQDDNNPDGDIAIQVIGLRPAEKLYEELLIGSNPRPTSHPRILRAHEEYLPLNELERNLAESEKKIALLSHEQIKELLKNLVQGYQPE